LSEGVALVAIVSICNDLALLAYLVMHLAVVDRFLTVEEDKPVCEDEKGPLVVELDDP
jgi:hypothetical protein